MTFDRMRLLVKWGFLVTFAALVVLLWSSSAWLEIFLLFLVTITSHFEGVFGFLQYGFENGYGVFKMKESRPCRE